MLERLEQTDLDISSALIEYSKNYERFNTSNFFLQIAKEKAYGLESKNKTKEELELAKIGFNKELNVFKSFSKQLLKSKNHFVKVHTNISKVLSSIRFVEIIKERILDKKIMILSDKEIEGKFQCKIIDNKNLVISDVFLRIEDLQKEILNVDLVIVHLFNDMNKKDILELTNISQEESKTKIISIVKMLRAFYLDLGKVVSIKNAYIDLSKQFLGYKVVVEEKTDLEMIYSNFNSLLNIVNISHTKKLLENDLKIMNITDMLSKQ